jgi:putative tricarboxylic transport membrane protein
MKKEIISILFWLVFGIYLSAESYHFGVGNLQRPGPGFFPFLASVFMGILSLFVLIKTLLSAPWKNNPTCRQDAPESLQWRRIPLAVCGMLCYILLFNRIGFLLCTFLFFIYLLQVVMSQRWLSTLVISVSVSAGSYLLFDVLLNAQLPKGLFKIF